jgi:CSLREA domain-containing protein
MRGPARFWRRQSAIRTIALLSALVCAVGFGAGPASGDVAVTVTATGDETIADGLCSLREAIDFANTTPDNSDCDGGGPTGTVTIMVPAAH